MSAGGGGSLVLEEMCNQVSAKVRGGGQKGGVLAVPMDCHKGKCSSCSCQMFALARDFAVVA